MSLTVLRLALSSLLGRTRSLGLLAMPLLLVVVCVLARFAEGGPVTPDGTTGRAVLAGLGITVVVPMLALLVCTRLLGNEVEDGTIFYLLSKPVPRSHVVLGKLVAAVLATWVLGAVPMLVSSLALDPGATRAGLGWFVGALAGAAAYCGVFLALAATTRHAVVWGLMYLVVWEGALGNLLPGIAKVSVGAWARRVAAGVGEMPVIAPSGVALPYAVAALTIALVAGTGWAVHRLRRLAITGD